MTEIIFNNKNGTLTPYAFACGYVEIYTKGDDRATLLRKPNDWHVKGFRGGCHFWESFERLSDARRFARTVGKLKQPKRTLIQS
jgi:hypothetical protein